APSSWRWFPASACLRCYTVLQTAWGRGQVQLRFVLVRAKRERSGRSDPCVETLCLLVEVVGPASRFRPTKPETAFRRREPAESACCWSEVQRRALRAARLQSSDKRCRKDRERSARRIARATRRQCA